NMLFLTLLFPLIGFLLLAFSRGRWSENTSALVGVGSVALSALVSAWVIFQYSTGALPEVAYIQVLWQWMAVGNFTPVLMLYLVRRSLPILGVGPGLGFLIHLFASWYLRGEAGYPCSFAYSNLFVASMLCLVLAAALLFLYLAW